MLSDLISIIEVTGGIRDSRKEHDWSSNIRAREAQSPQAHEFHDAQRRGIVIGPLRSNDVKGALLIEPTCQDQQLELQRLEEIPYSRM